MPRQFIARLRRLKPAKVLRHIRHPFLRLPGMVSHEERMDLYLTARRELLGRGAAVEFGAFLGASTAALQQGLRSSGKPAVRASELHVVDCFKTPADSAFAPLLGEIARGARIDHLVTHKDRWLCFYDAFLANVNADDPLLKVHRCFVSDLDWESRPVELLHLDLPKNWQQMTPIVASVLPDLIAGARILLQDFGYQWSAELIALTGHLASMGHLRPYRFTATTLSCIVDRPLARASIQTLQPLMADPESVLHGIELARHACRGLATRNQDLVLLMAKAQYLHGCGRVDECQQAVSTILGAIAEQGDAELCARLADLFRYGFVLPVST